MAGTDKLSDPKEIHQQEHDPTTAARKVLLVDTSGVPYAASGGAQPVQLKRNGVTLPVTLDTTTAANNQPLPTVSLAGDGLGPLDVSTGASTAKTRRVVLSTDSTVNQAGTWNITNVSGTVSLPTGASTETTLAAFSAKFPTGTNGGKVDAYQLGTWTVTQSGTWTVQAVQSGSWSLANLPTTVDTSAGNSSASTLRVVVASNQVTLPVTQQGRGIKGSNYFTHSSTGTVTWVSLSVTASAAGTEVVFWDTSGAPLEIGIDPAGGTSYVRAILVPPNGSGTLNVTFASGATFAVRSLSGTVSAGNLGLAVYG